MRRVYRLARRPAPYRSVFVPRSASEFEFEAGVQSAGHTAMRKVAKPVRMDEPRDHELSPAALYHDAHLALQRRPDAHEPGWTGAASVYDSIIAMAHGPSAGGVQAKLEVSEPDDEYEREADQVADTVMRMPAPELAEEEEEEEELELSAGAGHEIQAEAAPGGIHAPSAGAGEAIAGLKGHGQPLPTSERRFFEPRFGTDFGQVRVHADHRGDRAAQSINARAFTLGNDVAFRAGQYRPGARAGRELLAHELTHVVQQGGGGRLASHQPLTAIGRKVQRATDNDKLWKSIQDLAAKGKHKQAIWKLIRHYNMPTANLISICYDASLTSNAQTSGKIPGKSTVKIGPKPFQRGLADLVHTIRHELEHVEQRAAGMTNKNQREFEAEAVEIISKDMPEEDFKWFMSDARRCLKYWNKMSANDHKTLWNKFEEVRNKVKQRYGSASKDERLLYKPIMDGFNAVTKPK